MMTLCDSEFPMTSFLRRGALLCVAAAALRCAALLVELDLVRRIRYRPQELLEDERVVLFAAASVWAALTLVLCVGARAWRKRGSRAGLAVAWGVVAVATCALWPEVTPIFARRGVAEPNGDELRVLSFNVRSGNLDEGGPNSWRAPGKRAERTKAMLERVAPDVVGTQEASAYQLDDLGLPWVGDPLHDEAVYDSAVAYDPRRVRLLEHRTFWLSNTPHEFSKTPSSRCHRSCTWARFEHLATGAPFFVFNTHLDHASEAARRKQARVLLSDMRRVVDGTDGAVFVTGDFNAIRGGPVHEALLAGGQLLDAYRESPATGAATAGITFHAWHPDKLDVLLARTAARVAVTAVRLVWPSGPLAFFPADFHVDWILFDPRGARVTVACAEVIASNGGAGHVSDHHLVLARFAVEA